MEPYLEGLMLHDIILMVLGTLMFLVLLGGLVLQILRHEPVGKLQLIGFIIPALMIAYPSIQKVAFSKNVIELEKITQEVVKNPADTAAVRELQEKLHAVENRKPSSAETLAQLSKSNYALGNKTKAQSYAESSLEKEPVNAAAQGVKAAIELEKSVKEMQKNPGNLEMEARVDENIQTIKGLDLDAESKKLFFKPLAGSGRQPIDTLSR
jgi:hypothetical protein